MKNEMVEVVWRGVIYVITRQQFEDLQAGWISWQDMFE